MLDEDTATRDKNNTFKILIATDIHLGYQEANLDIGEDSFRTFEEILQIAKEQNVDFILLGGNLFHENAPSQNTLQRAVDLIREYTFGYKDIDFEVIDNFEEASDIMEDAIPKLNYCNPHVNIAYPIFAIHGNHDDPNGIKSISPLHSLTAMGLLNFIGQCDKCDKIEIKPLVIKKGDSMLAIYGVGHLSDRRFVRLHNDKKVTFYKVNGDSVFQMLMLHQNRANRGPCKYIPIEMIPKFIDLVMWGHEPDCRIEPIKLCDVYYTQPGSTVATSLNEDEAIPKQVGILYINQKDFHIEPIPLKSARIMIFRHEIFDTVENMVQNGAPADNISQYAESKVQELVVEMLEEAERRKIDHFEQFGIENDELPLIRILVQAMDAKQMFDEKKLGLLFADRVANPNDVIVLKRPYTPRAKVNRRACRSNIEGDNLREDDTRDLMTYIKRELEQRTDYQVFTVPGLGETINQFANCNDANAIEDYISYRKNKNICKLITIPDEANDEEIVQQIAELLLDQDEGDETNAVRNMFMHPDRVKVPAHVEEEEAIDDDNKDNDVPGPARPTRGRRGSRATRRGPRARGQKKN